MKKGAGVISLNWVSITLNWGSLKRVSGIIGKSWEGNKNGQGALDLSKNNDFTYLRSQHVKS